jgi:site-specific DNA-cytosine methylase
MSIVEIRHWHMCFGLGGGAKGFNQGEARVGTMEARFRCIGGVDVDAAGARDFYRLTGVNGALVDLFDREQYRDFHGENPPMGWREATPDDLRRSAGYERPHIVFMSMPCKAFSGLLSESKSKTVKYISLSKLTLRGIWLMLEAWGDDPPELIVFENVPRIATRGRWLLDQIVALLRAYGYAVQETTHDCGELGGLAQSRKRFLLVARHAAKVPAFLYEPPKRPLRAVGEILGRMLLPGDLRAGPMHRIPSLQWKTWVRLAFVEAGSDWRSLNKLAVEEGQLRDYLLVPEDSDAWHPNVLGVNAWDKPSGTVTSEARPTTGRFAVADPRYGHDLRNGPLGVVSFDAPAGSVAGENRATNGTFSVADPRSDQSAKWNDGQAYGVKRWEDSSATVTGKSLVGSGYFCVADPRHDGPPKHSNEFSIARWDRTSCAVTGAHGSGQCVADPRADGLFAGHGKYRITGFDESAGTVIATSTTGQGAFAVADPRPATQGRLFTKYPVAKWDHHAGTVIGGDDTGAYAVADPRAGLVRSAGDHYLTAGHYGVVPWDSSSGAVSGSACHDNGPWSVADPRIPAPTAKVIARIRALDGTWHRPFTTLELAALQSLIEPEEQLELDGLSDSAWRERIGNAVPPAAAKAIASEMGRTLLLAWSGETFQLNSTPVWVRPIAVALSVAPTS